MGINRRKFLGALSAITSMFGLSSSVKAKEPGISVPLTDDQPVKESTKFEKKTFYVKNNVAWHVNFVKELKLSFHASVLKSDPSYRALPYTTGIPYRSLILMKAPRLMIDNVVVENPYGLIELNHTKASEVPVTIATHHKEGCKEDNEPHVHPSQHLGIFIHDDYLRIGVNVGEVRDHVDISFSCDLAVYEFDPCHPDRQDGI